MGRKQYSSGREIFNVWASDRLPDDRRFGPWRLSTTPIIIGYRRQTRTPFQKVMEINCVPIPMAVKRFDTVEG